MSPLAIIIDFNIVKNIRFGYCSGPIVNPMYPLPFEQSKETFHHRVIVRIPGPTHTGHDPLILEELSVLAY